MMHEGDIREWFGKSEQNEKCFFALIFFEVVSIWAYTLRSSLPYPVDSHKISIAFIIFTIVSIKYFSYSYFDVKMTLKLFQYKSR